MSVRAGYPLPLRKLINELTKLPSIGERSAARLAMFIACSEPHVGKGIAEAIGQALSSVKLCKWCYFLAEEEQCAFCRDATRDRDLLCVVEKPSDVLAIERTGSFRGLYHVLHGVWSPMRGVRPEDLKLVPLIDRITTRSQDDPLSANIKELVLATSTTVEGEATAVFIAREVESSELKVSRIAQGLPRGGELEYADDLTLSMSFAGRREV